MAEAGDDLTTLDIQQPLTDVEAGSIDFTITSFGVAVTAGTYADCGVAFVAGTEGVAVILFAATLDNSGSTFTSVAPALRNGAAIGSGTTVLPASDDEAIAQSGTDARRFGGHTTVTGLTPGAAYNARLEHKTSGGTGTMLRRRITVLLS
jgi:hypothetical protein